MKKRAKRGLTALLAAVLLLCAVGAPAAAAPATDFPDVPEGSWYEPFIGRIVDVQKQMGVMNIISGYPDGTFGPEDEVLRGQFLKMLFEAAEVSGNQTAIVTSDEYHSWDHWAKKYYLKAQKDNILVADVYTSSEPMFSDSYSDLETPISRYEMAVILNNVCTNIAMQKTVIVNEPEQHITDYADIPTQYVTAVEQSYGKGLLTGNENGVFHGADTLTRAEAVVVLYRFLFVDTIQGDGLQDWAEYPKADTSNYLDPSQSFANWLRNGHVDAWGNIDAEARLRLFGNANKSAFYSSADAANYMTTVSVPIWTLDRSGAKVASTLGIQVNKAVADEVRSIFQMIFDDPEQFPIYGGWSAGGARFTDTMRHSWGCAIDINALFNCECYYYHYSGQLQVTCGYGYWPVNGSDTRFTGSLTAPSVYSIGKSDGQYGYSVVRAFATYGWGWGGNGWSINSAGRQKFDYMHFSVLPSGG